MDYTGYGTDHTPGAEVDRLLDEWEAEEAGEWVEPTCQAWGVPITARLLDGNKSKTSTDWTFTLRELADAEPHEVPTKKESPCFVPVLLTSKWQDSKRRPRKSIVGAGTALLYDLDHGDLDEDHLVETLDAVGWGCAYWPTWSCGSRKGRRWRVLIPLQAPVSRDAWETLWKLVARRLEQEVRRVRGDLLGTLVEEDAEVGKGIKFTHDTCIDWPKSLFTQLGNLPAVPDGSVPDPKEPWGGVHPVVELVEGKLLGPDDRIFPEGKTYKERKRRTFSGEAKPCKPFEASSARGLTHVPHLADGLQGGTHLVPCDALDAVEALKATGLNVAEGTRHDTMMSACWHLHRLGASTQEIAETAETIVASTMTDPAYARTAANKAFTFLSRKAARADRIGDRLYSAVYPEVPEGWRDRVRRYCRVLGRAEHLRTETGGAIDHGALAAILGFPDHRHLTFARKVLEDKGLVVATGEGRGRRYTVCLDEGVV